jgi:hypothetical protein
MSWFRVFCRGLAAGVCVVASAVPAFAQKASAVPALASAPAPSPTPGDLWTYRAFDINSGAETARYSWQFLRQETRRLVFQYKDLVNGTARSIQRTPNLEYCIPHKDSGAEACFGAFEFPLQVGKRHRYENQPIDGGNGENSETCIVEAAEKISVPAGTFDTFRIDCDGYWKSSFGGRDVVQQGKSYDVHWYAPSINAEVKIIVRRYFYKGTIPYRNQLELVSFRPGLASNDAAAAEGKEEPPPPTLTAMPTEFANGDSKMVGAFVHDGGSSTYSGVGKVTWANGDVYDGNIVKGLREGKGKFAWANGQRFEGTWHRDIPDGQGKMWFVGGNVYEGDVDKGVPTGQGTMLYGSGDQYVGEFTKGVPNGRGAYTWVNGQTLEGDWIEGVGHGEAVLKFANGDRYEGTLSAGSPNGQGRITYLSGDVYVGAFEAGVPHGAGIYLWTSGDRFEGTLNHGVKQGHGVMTWANGNTWDGEFVNGERTEGTLVVKK